MLIVINLLSLNNNLTKLKTNKINIDYFHYSINNRKLNVKFRLNLSYHLFKINTFLYIDLNNHFFKIIKDLFILIIIIINYNYFNKHLYLLIARYYNLQIKSIIY